MRPIHILTIVLAFVSNQLIAQLEICNWFEDKKGALVMTFDDWLEGHEKIVVPSLIEKNIGATFFVTTNNVEYRKEAFQVMRYAHSKGLEIANHTVSHPDLTALKLRKAKKEIKKAREMIMDSVPGAKCMTFAYPMGTKNKPIIDYLSINHIAARGVLPSFEGALKYGFADVSSDYFKLETVRMTKAISVRKVKNWLKFLEKGGGLLTFMFHSIYNDTMQQGWDAIHESQFQMYVNAVAAKSDRIWVTSLEKAIQYHKEKANTKISITDSTQRELHFTISNNLPSKVFDHPLTFKLKRSDSIIKQLKINGEPIKFKEENGYLLFNLLPFSGAYQLEIL